GKGLKFPEGFVLVSFVGLFNLLIEYFSNAISFVRLAAFALTHGALFSAFWIMTLMVLPTPGGGLWAAIIFLIGQLILVGLEGLVVFIQDLRLTYYEYFTKFFEGSGHPFKPLKFKA
ncbi:MAG: ATPase, partial [Spirochaetes bacterium]